MSKYDALWKYIQKVDQPMLTLTFEEIGEIAGVHIDHSFLKFKKELLEYGWEVGKISMKTQTVQFSRIKTAVLYVHGKGGNASESEHYRTLFPDADVIGLDYKAKTPWEAAEEFPMVFDKMEKKYGKIILIANSIGAYFSMHALADRKIEKAYFISPIVDMEKLISDMMCWAGATERELEQQKIIATNFGETLSWEYLCYVRSHPITWDVPTRILYGGQDNLTTKETISAFADTHKAMLTVMEQGEHWFHTAEQMAFLDRWIKENEEE